MSQEQGAGATDNDQQARTVFRDRGAIIATLTAELEQARAEVARLRALCVPIADLVQESALAKAEMDRMRSGAHEVGRISMAAVEREKATRDRAEAAEAREVALRERIARVEAELPNECRVLRTESFRCTDLVGGRIGTGPGKFTRDMCCLPCRLRAALAAEPTPPAAPHAEDGACSSCGHPYHFGPCFAIKKSDDKQCPCPAPVADLSGTGETR